MTGSWQKCQRLCHKHTWDMLPGPGKAMPAKQIIMPRVSAQGFISKCPQTDST